MRWLDQARDTDDRWQRLHHCNAIPCIRMPPMIRIGMRSRRLFLSLLFLAPLLLSHGVAGAQATPSSGYWHAAGPQLLDAAGNPVRIVGVTWYGMETAKWVPAGLDTQRYTIILDQVKLLGYNVVRLPLSNELVERNPVITRAVRANPDLLGLHALDVLDRLVAYAGSIGLKVILDNHRCRAARPLEINTLDEPLWYTKAYPQSVWLKDWQTLALRYRGNDTVIGFDLRNEPHTAGPGPWNLHAYLHQGATWGPYDGKSNPATDWRAAAERAGNAILAINPDVLIVVEGITLYPEAGSPNGVATSWWGGILTPALQYPVVLQVPGKLVYSVHDYGPRKSSMPWFQPLSYNSLDRAYRHNWAFVPDGASVPAAPLTARGVRHLHDGPHLHYQPPARQSGDLVHLAAALAATPSPGGLEFLRSQRHQREPVRHR